ncbi:MAG: hypothetical protein ACRCYC_05375 [Paraclostridium sp.]|uniref:hypothetical protein n=1 Tax=Paraclostridium sp. TaxID=2023273 RepID=UPI003F392D3F
MDRIQFYVFGEVGAYDKYNPYSVLNKTNISEIIYLIAKNDPFSLNESDIKNELDINSNELNNIINSLNLINAIEIKNDTYKLNFPVFLEKDIEILDLKLNEVAMEISNKIINLKDYIISKLNNHEQFNYKRILYHIICDNIFDGVAMDFFADKDIFCISKKQPGERNYIIVGYENTKKLETHSNNLLCSSNNYRTKDFIFNSFGDCNGDRKDVYRFFRQVDKNNDSISKFENLNNSYNTLNDHMNRNIMNDCGNLIINISKGSNDYNSYEEYDKQLLEFLKNINYINIDDKNKISIEVPIFDKNHTTIVNDISKIILPNIEDIVQKFLNNIEIDSSDITSVKHGIDIKEISNELWHQIFGVTNEYLVKYGFVEKPYSSNIEGRYLKSLYIK